MNFVTTSRSRSALAVGMATMVALLVMWGAWRWAKHTLPGIMRTRISAALDRDVTVREVDPWFTSLTVKGIRIARTRDANSGTQVSLGEIEFKFWLPALLWYHKAPARAIRRVVLVTPYVEVPLEALPVRDHRPARGERERASPGLANASIPRTWFEIKGGTVVLTRRGKPVAEVRRLGAKLDLRDFPSIEGGLKFVLAPESEVDVTGHCNMTLKDFHGHLALANLDLGQLADLARLMDPGLPVRLGGRLKADLEVAGGFITTDELFDKTEGHGSLVWDEGSLSLHGRELIAGASAAGSLDGRDIALESLEARVLAGRMNAVGSLGNLGVGRLRLKGRLDNVPVQALRALSPGLPETLAGTFNFEFSASGTGRAPVFAGRLTAPAMGVPGTMAERVTAEAVYSISEVRLTSFSAGLWDGTFSGSGAITALNAGGEPTLDFQLRGAGFAVGKSPVGERFAGTGELDAALKGPVRKFTGTLGVKVAGLTGHGIVTGDLEATARFDAGRIAVTGATLTKGVGLHGTIVLGEDARIEGGEVTVRELLPVLFAISGLQPPAGLQGRVSGRILVEGPLRDPAIVVEAVGSAIRFGTIAVADLIRIPRFIFSHMALEVPENQPLELEWGPEQSMIQVSGRVPVGTFTGEGKDPLRLHLEAHRARLDLLKRFDLITSSEGSFDLVADLGGTASLPVWSKLELTGEGKKLVLKEKFFDGDFDFWKVNIRMKDGEAEHVLFELGVAKQRQVLTGSFGMNGWLPASADLTTETVAASRKAKDLKGLPLLVEDVAEIRTRLFARLVKLPNEDDALLTGPDPDRGAELVLSDGTISYIGGGRGGARTTGGKPGEPAKPSPISEWFGKHFSFRGTVAFGRKVSYEPASFLAKGAIKGFKSIFGDRDAFKKFLKSYTSRSGVTQGLTEEMLALDVKVKDGSFIGVEVRPGHETRAVGHLDLEPGGKVTFAHTVEFKLVDEPGLAQRVEFQPGEHLEAHVSLVAETELYDKMFSTPQGAALVDEMAVRLVLTPPGPNDPPQEGFLKYRFDIKAEPETVNGEVEVADEKTAGAADPAAPGAADAGPRTRPVSFIPDRAGLYSALFGFDRLTSTAGTPAASTQGGSEAVQNLKQTATTSVVNAVLSRIGKLLFLDTLSMRKSDVAKHKARAPAPTGAAGGTAAGGSPAASSGLVASTLQNNEFTAGKALTRNLFLNMHGIMLDSAALSQRSVSGVQTQQSTSLGLTAELEYRRSFYKFTLKRRAFALPDDPKPKDYLGEGELYLGGEMSQNFTGVSQREPFRW